MCNASIAVYPLKISLVGISLMIWRRVLAPADLTLYRLHRVRVTFGSADHHLHAFHLHGRR